MAISACIQETYTLCFALCHGFAYKKLTSWPSNAIPSTLSKIYLIIILWKYRKEKKGSEKSNWNEWNKQEEKKNS